MPFTVADFHDLVRLLAENPQWRAQLRQLVLTEELLELPVLVHRLAAWQETMAEEHRGLVAEVRALVAEVRNLAESHRTLAEEHRALAAEVRTLAEEHRALVAEVRNLAVAQARTEQRLEALAAEHTKTRRLLGDLSTTVGYTLENAAYKALPALLERDYGLIVEGRLKRGYLTARDGRPLEINILGRGRRNGEEVIILGESKAQLSKNNIDRFLKRKLKLLPDLGAPVFVIFITHMTSEADAEAYAREQGAVVYYSYDF